MDVTKLRKTIGESTDELIVWIFKLYIQTYTTRSTTSWQMATPSKRINNNRQRQQKTSNRRTPTFSRNRKGSGNITTAPSPFLLKLSQNCIVSGFRSRILQTPRELPSKSSIKETLFYELHKDPKPRRQFSRRIICRHVSDATYSVRRSVVNSTDYEWFEWPSLSGDPRLQTLPSLEPPGESHHPKHPWLGDS